MFDVYSLRSVHEDRDLSRAASERYLLLQAVSERRSKKRVPRAGRLDWLPRAFRTVRTRST